MGAAHSHSAWDRIRAHLEDRMRRVRDEIRSYPAPIPACDAQYNFLLEQREALTDELHRLRELMGGGDGTGVSVEAFLDQCASLDDEARRTLRAGVSGEIGRGEGGR